MKKVIKRIIASLTFCLLLVGCGKFFRYILIDDTASYTRIALHEMYEQDNIDTLFVGSSHCYRAFIPEILDKELKEGVNTFNLGTSAQDLDGSYMLIKEAAKYNDIKNIYLDLYFAFAFGEAYKDRTQMTSTYIISDYLKPSLDKIQYLLNASAKDYYSSNFITSRRYWNKIFDADYVKNLLIKKGTKAYKNYGYKYVTGESEWYASKGYVANKGKVENWNFFGWEGWDSIKLTKLSEDWLNSLEDIIDFCDKKGITLTFVVIPMSNYLLSSVGNYDDYVSLVRKLFVDKNVKYYDFNMCKEKYFPNDSSLFLDDDHLNCFGAESFNHLFADFVNGEISEDELFYDTYEEKVKNLEPTVFGISYHDIDTGKGEKVRNCKIVSTGNDNLEYKIVLSPQDGESRILQKFSSNRYFDIDPTEHGVINITYRLTDKPNETKKIDVTY